MTDIKQKAEFKFTIDIPYFTLLGELWMSSVRILEKKWQYY